MIVCIAKDLFTSNEAFDNLDQIVHLFAEGRHTWHIVNPDDIEMSKWIQSDFEGRAGRRNLEIFKKAFTDQAYPKNANRNSVKVFIVKESKNRSQVSINQALSCLNSPVLIVVENAESDTAFFRMLIHAFNRNKLNIADKNNWISFYHLGGFGEIEKRVNDAISKLVGPCRIVVLTDSDKSYPGEITAVVKKTEDYCTKVGICYKILSRRSIENYIPIEILSLEFPRKGRKIASFKSLNKDQKAYYNMKSGFKYNWHDKDKMKQEEYDLFSNLKRNIYEDLTPGFGQNLWKCFFSHKEHFDVKMLSYIGEREKNEIEVILDCIENYL